MIYRRFDKTGYEIKGYEYLSMRFMRSLSIPIARKLSKYSYPPERIVAISIFLEIVATFLVTFGQRYPTLLAGVILFIAWLLDYVDGDLARMQNRITYFGDWFDSIAGKLIDVILYPCICFGIYRHTQSIYIWFLGFAIIGGIYFSSMMNNKIKLMKLRKGLPNKAKDKPAEKRRGLLKAILHETTAGSDLVFYSVIFGALINRMFWALWICAIYIWLYSVFTIYVTYKSVIELDKIK